MVINTTNVTYIVSIGIITIIAFSGVMCIFFHLNWNYSVFWQSVYTNFFSHLNLNSMYRLFTIHRFVYKIFFLSFELEFIYLQFTDL